MPQPGLIVTSNLEVPPQEDQKGRIKWLKEYTQQTDTGWAAVALVAAAALESLDRNPCGEKGCKLCLATAIAVEWLVGQGGKTERFEGPTDAVDAVLAGLA